MTNHLYSCRNPGRKNEKYKKLHTYALISVGYELRLRMGNFALVRRNVESDGRLLEFYRLSSSFLERSQLRFKVVSALPGARSEPRG